MPWMVPLWWKQLWCSHTNTIKGVSYVTSIEGQVWTQCLTCGRRVVTPKKGPPRTPSSKKVPGGYRPIVGEDPPSPPSTVLDQPSSVQRPKV
jgi:hypothetical protein